MPYTYNWSNGDIALNIDGLPYFNEDFTSVFVNLVNGTNGYALKLFLDSGANGAFGSSELSSSQYRNMTVPQGIELWSPLVAPTFLMKSRHCLIRNCINCGKSVMDESFLFLARFVRDKAPLSDLARMGEFLHELHFSSHSAHECCVEANDLQGIVSQLHGQHLEVEVNMRRELAGVFCRGYVTTRAL